MAQPRSKAPLITKMAGGVATVTLNRPHVHNAFDDDLIKRLTLEFAGLDRDPTVRAIVLSAEGKSFCAGADLNWMRRMADYDRMENLDDAMGVATLMKTIARCTKPTVAAVQGAAYGGGVGLVAACDIAIAAKAAPFCLSEARLGLIPATIGPYVVAAMGERQARRYMMSTEVFTADEARRVGLVHEVVAPRDLKNTVKDMVAQLMLSGPRALAEVKNLVLYASGATTDDEKTLSDTAGHLARVRSGPEGKEGVSAFLEKRKPAWVKKS